MLDRKLAVARYMTTPTFQAIPEHTAVCFDDDEMLVAVTGPSGDGESLEYARLFAASPALLQACKNAVVDLEWRTKYKHNALPAQKQHENPAVTMLRELTAAIKAAEPDWE